jgi:hypothetical protein
MSALSSPQAQEQEEGKAGQCGTDVGVKNGQQPHREVPSVPARASELSPSGCQHDTRKAAKLFQELPNTLAFQTPRIEPDHAHVEQPLSQFQQQASQALLAAHQSQTLLERLNATQAGDSVELPTQRPDPSPGASQVAAEVLHVSQQVWIEGREGPAALGAWEMDALRDAFEQSALSRHVSARQQAASVNAAAAAAIELQYGQEAAEILDAGAEAAVSREPSDAFPCMDGIPHKLLHSGSMQHTYGNRVEDNDGRGGGRGTFGGSASPLSGLDGGLGGDADALRGIAVELEHLAGVDRDSEEGDLGPRVRGSGLLHESAEGHGDVDMNPAPMLSNEDEEDEPAEEELQSSRQAVQWPIWPRRLPNSSSQATDTEPPVLPLAPPQGSVLRQHQFQAFLFRLNYFQSHEMLETETDKMQCRSVQC